MSTKSKSAIFGDDAMQRLAALTARRKDGGRLSGAEAIELRELQNLKARAHLAKVAATIAKDRRLLEDRDKYRLGDLALTAGLQDWSDEDLRAGFAHLAALGEDEKAALLAVAANADTQTGGDEVAAPVTSTTASPLMPAPTPGSKEALPDQAQAEPMAEAVTSMTAPMSHEPSPVRRLGRLM